MLGDTPTFSLWGKSPLSLWGKSLRWLNDLTWLKSGSSAKPLRSICLEPRNAPIGPAPAWHSRLRMEMQAWGDVQVELLDKVRLRRRGSWRRCLVRSTGLCGSFASLSRSKLSFFVSPSWPSG